MSKFAIGSAMGFMLGAGLMMMPCGEQLRRDMTRKTHCMKRMLKKL